MYVYIDKLCEIIINDNNKFVNIKPIKINWETIKRPFGQIRLSCLEILGMIVDLSMLNAAKPLSCMKIQFWEKLLDLVFVHKGNNFFLNQFRRIIHLTMLFIEEY